MNCRPCLYVFLVVGGFFLIVGLCVFALGVLKLVIRVKSPEDGKLQADWRLTKPANAGDMVSVLLNQNAVFVMICGLLAILLAVLLLFPGWLCLRRSDRQKRRRQAKGDAEAAHVDADAHEGSGGVVVADTHEVGARPTDPLLSGVAVTAVEVGVNGIPHAVPEDDEEEQASPERRPLREKEKEEEAARHRSGDGHVVYEKQQQATGHQNPLYGVQEEHSVVTHSQQHHYEHSSFHYPDAGGLGPMAPVPALAVHRVVEEEEEDAGEDEAGAGGADGGREGADDDEAEDPPFANEGYVYASVKRTDRHSRSPSDESASKATAQEEPPTSPRTACPAPVNEEGRSALLQKAHDLVDEVLRAASDTSTSHSLRMSAEAAPVAQEDLYDKAAACESPIPSVHEEDELPAFDEAEEEADHRSVTSSEEGVAHFNAPTPEITHAANAAILEEDEEGEMQEEEAAAEEEEEEQPPPAPMSGNHVEAGGEQPGPQIDLLIGAHDIMAPTCDRHSDDEAPPPQEDEEEEQEANGRPGYEFEDIPQYGIAEIPPPPPPVAAVPEEEEREEEEEVEEARSEEEEEEDDPNANVAEQEVHEVPEPPPPAPPVDLIFTAYREPSEAEESADEGVGHAQDDDDDDASEPEDVNANTAGAALVHISPEDDVEISELLGPQVLRQAPSDEGSEVELPPPSSPSPPPPPPPPGMPEEGPIIDFGGPDQPEAESAPVDVMPALEPNLLADLGVYEGEEEEPPSPEMEEKHQPPPPAASEAFDDLVNFDDPEASATPPPPPPPPPPLEDDAGDGWNSQF